MYKIRLLFLLSSLIFCQPCFADPSEFLLKSLSRHSLAFTSHHPPDENLLPVILTPDERDEEFKKVLRQVLADVSKSEVSRSFKDKDILLLKACLNSKNSLSGKDCDSEIIKIAELLLFYQPNFKNSIRANNPSYLALKKDYPHAKLKHDTTLESLKDI